jgi:hypothetical protein
MRDAMPTPRSRPPSRPLHRLLALVGASTLLLTACGSSTTTSAPPTATSTPAATPAPTATPTPTATPKAAWVDAVAALADPRAVIKATIAGDLDIGAKATVAGTYQQNGTDLGTVLDVDLNGTDIHTEQRNIGSETYLLAGPLWRHDLSVSGAGRANTLASVMAKVTGATSKGKDTVDGQAVERYELTGLDIGAFAAALGLGDPGATVTDADLTLLATADGKPLAIDVALTVPGTPTASWDLRISFRPAGGTVAIQKPDQAWIVKQPGNGYSIWYPDTFQAESDAGTATEPFSDWYIGEKETARISCVPTGDYTLASWVKEGQAFYADHWGGKHDQKQSFELPVGKAVLSVWESADIDGEKSFVNLVSIVTKPLACDILWFRGLGVDGDSDMLFGQMVGTFQVE